MFYHLIEWENYTVRPRKYEAEIRHHSSFDSLRFYDSLRTPDSAFEIPCNLRVEGNSVPV